MCIDKRQIPVREEEKSTKFHTSERKEYGTIKSVDFTPAFLREYLTAEMYCSNYPPVEDEGFRKMWEEKVKPFFTHMNEILDTL